jgi:hypothetical protein
MKDFWHFIKGKSWLMALGGWFASANMAAELFLTRYESFLQPL